MSRKTLHVIPGKSGRWTVSERGKTSQEYSSKAEAVSVARSKAGPVEVRTSAGQVIRPAALKTSKSAVSIRDAVMKAVVSRSK